MVLLSNYAEVEVLDLDRDRVGLTCFEVVWVESSPFGLTPFLVNMEGLFIRPETDVFARGSELDSVFY